LTIDAVTGAITPSSSTAGTYTITYTVSAAGGCAAVSATATVTFLAVPFFLDTSLSICSDLPIGFTFPSNTTPAVSSWNIIDTIIGSGLVAANSNFQIASNGSTTTNILSSIQNDKYTNTTNTNLTVTYRVIPLGTNGCLGDTFDIVVTILPEPVVNNTNLNDWCSNLAIGQAFPISIPSSITTAWYYVNSITLTNASPSNGTSLGVSTGPIAITNPLNPTIRPAQNSLGQPSMVNDSYSSINSNGTAIYFITPLSAQGCLGTPFTMSINIIPSAIQMLNTDTLMICSGEQVNLNLLSNTPSLIATWNAVTANTTLQTPTYTVQTSSIINDELDNPETYTQEMVYSVNFVGIITNPGSNCPGSASNVHVFVVPKPVIQPINDQILCPNLTISPVIVNCDIPSSIITWSTAGDNIGLPIVPINTLLNPSIVPGFTSINSQQTDQNVEITLQSSYTYTIPNTSLSETCDSSESYMITVKPVPEMLDQNLAAICSELNLNVPFNASNNGVPGIDPITNQYLGAVSYDLVALNLNGLSIFGGNVGAANGLTENDLEDDSYTNTLNDTISVIYEMIPVITYPIVNGTLTCEGELFTVTAPIIPEPFVANVTLTICSDTELEVILPDDVDGPFVATNGYSISNISIPSFIGNSGGLPIICNDTNNMVLFDDKWNNVTLTTPNDILYTIIPKAEATGCIGNPFTVTATINPEPEVDDLTLTVCSKAELTTVNFNTSNGVSTTSYVVNALNPSPNALDSLFAGGPILASPPISLSEPDFENDAFRNRGSSLYIINYQISPFSNALCKGEEFTMTVNINPEPVGVNEFYNYCSDSLFGIDLQQQVDNGGNGVSSNFNWTLIPPVNGGLITPGTIPPDDSSINPGPHIVGPIENLGGSPGILTYNVIPTSINPPFGCVGDPFQVEITIKPEPVVSNLTISVCSESELAFNLPNNGGTYALNNISHPNTTPNQIISTPQNNLMYDFLYDHAWRIDTIAVGPTMQTVTYNLTETGSNLCSSDPFNLFVQVNPIPIIQFNVQNAVNCTETDLFFNNTSTPGIDYSWDFDDGTFGFVENPTHEYVSAGTYNVELIGTYPNTGCTDSKVIPIVVNYLPDSNFTLSHTQGCDQLDVTLNAVDLNDDWSYFWDFGNGETSNQGLFTSNQFTTEGCYDVSLTITTPEGCVSTHTETNAVCMYDTPQASFELDDYVINNIDNDVQVFNNTVDATSYFWDFGDGTTTMDFEPMHAYADIPSTYVVQLTAFNEIGCLDVAYRDLLYWQDLLMYVPNTFTPDGDAYNQDFLPIISEGYKPETYQMQVFNRWGELVFESNDSKVGWDGTYGTNRVLKCQQGTYTWVIRLELLQNGESKVFTGHVNLLK
jgi:gliding motility-associated-like protein